MDKVQSHRDLIVWQKSMDLAVEVYRLTACFPVDERFRLISQITRSVSSVPANIAEGHARGSRKEYANFMAIAKGSLMETETFLTLAARLGYLKPSQSEPVQQLVTEISKMITTIRARLLEA
jgi:four helix bundle protein